MLDMKFYRRCGGEVVRCKEIVPREMIHCRENVLSEVVHVAGEYPETGCKEEEKLPLHQLCA